VQQRGFMFAGFGQHGTQVQVCTCVVRPQLQRAPEFPDSSRQITQFVQGIAQVVAQHGLIGHLFDRFADVLHRSLMIALLMTGQSKQVQRIGVVRLLRKDRLIERPGRLQLTGPVMSRGTRQQFPN